jgi:uncharacterized membrane protein required for colicin V production
MMSLNLVFWIFVVMFALIGMMRGWAKELLVIFTVVLALFIITVLARFVGPVRPYLTGAGEVTFWSRSFILLAMTFFGYQTPNLPKLSGGRFAREKLQDALFGLVLGGFNGYLVAGSIWFFMHVAEYPFELIVAPSEKTAAGEAALQLIRMLPPTWLVEPTIYFAVAIAFAFVVIVFI